MQQKWQQIQIDTIWHVIIWEYNKLNASTHVINLKSKAKLCINSAFQKHCKI